MSGSQIIAASPSVTIKKMVFQVMHAPPSDFGFNQTTWKLDELQEGIAKSGIQVGRHSIRRIVKDAGYRWLKAREVLTSNDPEYRQKLSDIKRILGNLQEREGFFSIDEYGPFSVKNSVERSLFHLRKPLQYHNFKNRKVY